MYVYNPAVHISTG